MLGFGRLEKRTSNRPNSAFHLADATPKVISNYSSIVVSAPDFQPHNPSRIPIKKVNGEVLLGMNKTRRIRTGDNSYSK